MAGTMVAARVRVRVHGVSMESGLDGRNNVESVAQTAGAFSRLNGVRPRWPEQFQDHGGAGVGGEFVSMESGLDGRNNLAPIRAVMVRPLTSQWSPA